MSFLDGGRGRQGLYIASAGLKLNVQTKLTLNCCPCFCGGRIMTHPKVLPTVEKRLSAPRNSLFQPLTLPIPSPTLWFGNRNLFLPIVQANKCQGSPLFMTWSVSTWESFPGWNLLGIGSDFLKVSGDVLISFLLP